MKGYRNVRKQVLETLGRLRLGDMIRVIWIDASLTRNVHTGKAIPNGVVATYKHTPGFYIGVFEDDRYREPHILVSVEDTDSQVQDVQSMPLAVVMRIRILQEITALVQEKEVVLVAVPSLKVMRADRVVLLPGGERKIVLRKRVKDAGRMGA